jgi:hypothetical protein
LFRALLGLFVLADMLVAAKHGTGPFIFFGFLLVGVWVAPPPPPTA